MVFHIILYVSLHVILISGKMSTRNIHMMYLKLCVPLSFRPVVGTALVTLNFITDWMGYVTYNSLQLRKQVLQRFPSKNITETQETIQLGYLELTAIYLCTCLLSSVVYFLHMICLYYSFLLQRKRELNKKDGFTAKESSMDKYGGEILLLLQTLFENIPVMLILFLSKAFLTCYFVVIFDKMVFKVIIIATVINIIWKFGLVIWNASCLGCREEYYSGYKYAFIRISTLFFLLICTALTCINLIYYFSTFGNAVHKYDSSNHIPFHGLHIERWLHEDQVSLILEEKRLLGLHENTTTSQNVTTIKNDDNTHYQWSYKHINITDIQELVIKGTEPLVYNLPCNIANTSLIDIEDASIQDNCTLFLAMLFNPNNLEIHYSFLYQYYINNSCTTGKIVPKEYASNVYYIPVPVTSNVKSTVSNIGDVNFTVSSTKNTSTTISSTYVSNSTVPSMFHRHSTGYVKSSTYSPLQKVTLSAGQSGHERLQQKYMYFNISFLSTYLIDCPTVCNYAFIYNEALLSYYDLC